MPDAIVVETLEEVGGSPTGIAVGVAGDRGYVTNADDDTVTVIESDADGNGWSVGATIDVGDRPGPIAVDDRYAYVVNRGAGTLSLVDLDANREIDTDLSTLQLDRIAVGDATNVAVAVRAAAAGESFAAAAVPVRATPKIRVNPAADRLYASKGSKVSVIDTRARVAARTVGAEAAADTDSLRVVREVDLGGEVTALELSPDGRRLYATVAVAGGTVTALAVLDAQSDELATIGAVRVGREPSGIAVSSDGNRGYVLNDGDRTMSVVYLRRLAEVDVVETGPAAGLAFVPGRDRVLVTNPDRRAVSVISTPFDEPTVVKADTATVDDDSAVNIAVTANDTSRTGTAILTPRVVAAPLNGTATVSVDRTITYIPNADFNGQDTFTYTSDDGTNFSNVAIVTVTVAAVNDTPTATDDTATTGEDNSVTIDVLGNDVDVESSALAPTLVSAPTNGTATVNFDGTITYQPNADFDGVDSFTYAVSDGALSDLAVVSVSVTPAIAIRLTWDADPRDLDAHLLGPSATGDGPGFHVFYSTPSYNVDGTTGGTAERAAFLVGDDTDGFGPEVTEINRRTPGEYLYYVERFAGEAPLADSNASVTVEDPSTGVARTFSVNPESSGEFWSVFRLTVSPTGEVTITPVDEYGNTEPMLAATAAEAL